MRVFYTVSYTGFMVYMVPNALATGLTPKEASFLTTAFGTGTFAGLCLGTFLARFSRIFFYMAIIPLSFVTALLLAVDPLIHLSFIGQFVTVFGIGAGLECLMIIVAIVSRKLPFGDDSLGVLYGWLSFSSGVSSAVGDVFIGASVTYFPNNIVTAFFFRKGNKIVECDYQRSALIL